MGTGRVDAGDIRWEGAAWLARTGGQHLRYSGGDRLERLDHGFLSGELETPAGDWHDLVLEISADPFDDAAADPAETWRTPSTPGDRPRRR